MPFIVYGSITNYDPRPVAARSLIPTDLETSYLQIWLDAADSSTITTVSTTNYVATWKDKSGKGYDFSGNSSTVGYTNCPQTNTRTINSMNVMDLQTNATSYFNSISSTINSGTSYSVFIVAYSSATLVSSYIRPLTDNYWGILQNTNTKMYCLFGSGAGSWNDSTTLYTTTLTNPTIFSFVTNSNGTSGTTNLYVNGTGIATQVGNNASLNSKIIIGIDVGLSSQYLKGTIAEVLMYNNISLSDGERQQIEGYLAWKWGLQANLPTQHIYKTFAPMVNLNININNTGLLHYYPFDANFYDNVTGTLASTTGVTLSSLRSILTTNSLTYPSSNTEYCDISSCTFTANSGITIGFWFYGNTTTQTTYGRIFDFSQYATGTANSTNIYSSWLASANCIHLGYSSDAYGFNYSTALSQNVWHHLCYTISASSTPILTLYVDGASVTVTAAQGAYPNTSLPFINCRIGRATQNEFFRTNGYCNSFVVFNRCLTPTEIGYLYKYPSTVTFTSAATT